MLYSFSKKFLDVPSAHGLVRALMHVAARSTSSLEHGGNMLLYSKISSCQREFFGLDIVSWFENNFSHQHFFISPYFSTAVFSFLRKLSWRAINSPTAFVRFRWSCILAYILAVNYLMHGHPCLIMAPTTFLSLYAAPCLIDAPHDNCSKILGSREIQQNHSMYSVSCLISKRMQIAFCSLSSSK